MKKFKIPNRQVFEKKVKDSFQFLLNEHDFKRPEVTISDYRVEIVYCKNDVAVAVVNAWHPADYGFEVRFFKDRKLLAVISDNIKTHEMVFYKVKEDQDANLQFIEDGALSLKNFLNQNKG